MLSQSHHGFPDLTRYQAEADQASVNQGHQPWKLSAMQVATTLAMSLLNWLPGSSSATLLSGGGPRDVSAVANHSRYLYHGSFTFAESALFFEAASCDFFVVENRFSERAG